MGRACIIHLETRLSASKHASQHAVCRQCHWGKGVGTPLLSIIGFLLTGKKKLDCWCLVITRPCLFIQPWNFRHSHVWGKRQISSNPISFKSRIRGNLVCILHRWHDARTSQSDAAMICLVVAFTPWLRSCEAHGSQRGLTSDPIIVHV